MYYFEYNEQKSNSNQEKHGIDFLESQKLWLDPDIIEIKANFEVEPRYLVIGKIKEKNWSAVITYRGDNIRIISVRRSRAVEVALYES
ncbi:MAG: BrnT family toxin [Aquificaceae bacterium]|nr:MAG: BrnT family toxin [Aquificaceae bacterium]